MDPPAGQGIGGRVARMEPYVVTPTAAAAGATSTNRPSSPKAKPTKSKTAQPSLMRGDGDLGKVSLSPSNPEKKKFFSSPLVKKKKKQGQEPPQSETAATTIATPKTKKKTTTKKAEAVPRGGEGKDDVSTMRVSAMKKELESYGISTTSFVEKTQLVQALVDARSKGLKVKQKHDPPTRSAAPKATTPKCTSAKTTAHQKPQKARSGTATAAAASQTRTQTQPAPRQFQQPQSFNPMTDVNIIGTWETDNGQVTTYRPDWTFTCEIPFFGTMTGRWVRQGDTYHLRATDGNVSTFRINNENSSPGLAQVQFPDGAIHWWLKKTTASDPYSTQQMDQQLAGAMDYMKISGQQMDQSLNAALNSMNQQTQQLNQGLNTTMNSMNQQTQQLNQGLNTTMNSMNQQTQQLNQGLNATMNSMNQQTQQLNQATTGNYNPYVSQQPQQQQQQQNSSNSFAQSAGEFLGGFVSGFSG